MSGDYFINTRIFRDVSLNTLQVLANQFLGLFIFLLLSRYLEKDVYGEFNWCLALFTCATTILSFRLEQIVVRNVAAGKDPSGMLTLFAGHNLLMATVFFGAMALGYLVFPGFFARHTILWIMSISQFLSFFSLPFRQIVTGKAAFGWLAALSTISNLIRCCWLGWMALFSVMDISRVLLVFTISALAELLFGAFIVFRQLRVPLDRRKRFSDYVRLIGESLPQAAMVFLQAGMARMDWILMGLIATPAMTAEYSFAYRAFEFSPLPLLVLAPFLLNSFSRHYGSHELRASPPFLEQVVRLELVLSTCLPLWLVIVWSPLVDAFTAHKYGQVNADTFLILSCCIPFQYLVNIYWTAEFASNRLMRIFRITAISAACMLAGDLILIPALGGRGAALAYLAAMVVQYILYARSPVLAGYAGWAKPLTLVLGISFFSGWAAWILSDSPAIRLLIASLIYLTAMVLTGRIGKKDLGFFKSRLEKERSGITPLLPGKSFGR